MKTLFAIALTALFAAIAVLVALPLALVSKTPTTVAAKPTTPTVRSITESPPAQLPPPELTTTGDGNEIEEVVQWIEVQPFADRPDEISAPEIAAPEIPEPELIAAGQPDPTTPEPGSTFELPEVDGLDWGDEPETITLDEPEVEATASGDQKPEPEFDLPQPKNPNEAPAMKLGGGLKRDLPSESSDQLRRRRQSSMELRQQMALREARNRNARLNAARWSSFQTLRPSWNIDLTNRHR